MTDTEHESIRLAIHAAQDALDKFSALVTPSTEVFALYDPAKPVHTAALGVWSTVVDLLRAQQGLDVSPNRSEIDAINLEELFKETADG